MSLTTSYSCYITSTCISSSSQALSKKLTTLYSLAAQQLSKQDHYDFGLRGLVSLLKYAGNKKRSQPDMPDDEVTDYSEVSLLIYLPLCRYCC